MIKMLWRAFRRCPDCGVRLCPVYGAGRGAPTPAIYLMHRGFRA